MPPSSSRYRNTRFLSSADALAQLPPDEGREVAFAGRSNAGKSSALNTITGQRALARTSKTPGRTRLLNSFEVAPGLRLVDLPGYGFARVPETVRRHWQGLLASYFGRRLSLAGLMLVMDVRHPLTSLDRQMLDWCAARPLPVHVLLTKADKLGRGAAMSTLQQVRRELATLPLPASAQLFSAAKGTGLEEAVSVLDRWLAPVEGGDRGSRT